jgi:ATP/maltotriose-dependent transcriptional regulator MalT
VRVTVELLQDMKARRARGENLAQIGRAMGLGRQVVRYWAQVDFDPACLAQRGRVLRQRIVELRCLGWSRREIADDLRLALTTVRWNLTEDAEEKEGV